MSRFKTQIESITLLKFAGDEKKIIAAKVWRSERDQHYEHSLNVKVFSQALQKPSKTLYEMAEKILAVDRVCAVEVSNAGGNGIHLVKELYLTSE